MKMRPTIDMKNIFTLLMALLMFAAISGCGSQSSDSLGSITPPDGTYTGGGSGGGTTPPVDDSLQYPLTVTIAAVPAEIAVGTTITFTATVTQADGNPADTLSTIGTSPQFSFVLGNGDFIAANNVGGGDYEGSYTATQIGTLALYAQALGYNSDTTLIDVVAGPAASLTFTSSRSKIEPDGVDASVLTVTATDQFGNPAKDAYISIVLTTTAQTPETNFENQTNVLAPDGVFSVNFTAIGEGVAVFQASVTGVTETKTVSVAVEESLIGIPHHIVSEVENPEISVSDSGGVSVTKVTLHIQDYLNNQIDDSGANNNVLVYIVGGPNGGENIQGSGLGDPPYSLTSGSPLPAGDVEFALSAGTRPGTVQVVAVVAIDKTQPIVDLGGGSWGNAIVQEVAKVYIRSGPPFSLLLYRSNAIEQSAGDLTHDYLAIVTDRWGNNVPDDTGVYFGQIVNLKIQGAGTILPPGDAFSYTGIGDMLELNDVVVITDTVTNYRGAYIVDGTIDANTVQLASFVQENLAAPITNVSFVGGNNDRGGVFQGNLGIGFSSTVDGIAVASNTYPGYADNCDPNGISAHVNTPVVIWAETEAREIGDSDWFNLSWVAPTNVELIGSTTPVPEGVPHYSQVLVYDSSTPSPYPIPDIPITISASAGRLSVRYFDRVAGTRTSWIPAPELNTISIPADCGGSMEIKWEFIDLLGATFSSVGHQIIVNAGRGQDSIKLQAEQQ
ncbi:MAG: hypothetical protein C0609_05160 [Deltaproteobacteria bacterium]|nr:MAG: hypothetical protein C0609_05160 [Deltaproteobacteria bacterium]